jgi:hypothetical protein
MDGMLRFLKLPTWTRADVNELMKKLGANERGRAFVERYISAPSEKALAREKVGTYMSQSSGWATIDLARQRVLEFCQKTKPACELIMENDRWLAADL